MEIPDLVRQSLGDEEIQAGVNLGDDDAVCFTPTRTLVYRGEGLLSDEGVSEYPHDFERLAVSEGRRKTKFSLTYVDEKAEFAVPGKRTSAVLERLLEGNFRATGVVEPDEGVSGVFRFSELTLIVTEQRLLKHIGEFTWGADFEVYPYDEVTGLHFEDGSVATAIVLEAGGHPERIKAPNDQAALVRKTLEGSLFAYYEVDSLEQLNRKIAPSPEEDDEPESAEDDADSSRGLGLDSDIDPLVSDAGDETDDEEPSAGTSSASAGQRQSTASVASNDGESASTASTPASTGRTDEELAAVEEQLSELTSAVEQQNELLKQQQKTFKQLIKELRQGR